MYENIIKIAGELGPLLGFLASSVTALYTYFLWKSTKTLSVETKRMVDIGLEPSVICTFEPNRWSINYIDVYLENTGKASAYDVECSYDPPLTRHSGDRLSLSKASLLKPGQKISCATGSYEELSKNQICVTVSWRREKLKPPREAISYSVDIGLFEGMRVPDAEDPLVKISRAIDKIQNDFGHIASGFKKLQVETFNAADRKKRHEDEEEWIKEQVEKHKN